MDIQFGEMEEAQPDVHLRPDQNKHYAVVAVDAPSDVDLPIFVDVDAMCDMETHALTDTSIELGGVLLGGQYTDDEGRPFVIVTDSLRAKHYEATKGSFKFTHDTWEQISRERDEFPDELQIVGWYHTHPDWGVFLSGMDMFICDNFFNRPLDLALVIDPCSRDRGMFQWTQGSDERIRRTNGFYLMASRFRIAELEAFVSELRGPQEMASARQQRPVAGQIGMAQAPVVNITDQRPQYQSIAIIGMLAMQLLLIVVLAWRVLAPATETETAKPAAEVTELSDRIADLEAKVDESLTANRSQVEANVQTRVLERVLKYTQTDAGDIVADVERQEQLLDRLNSEKLAYQISQQDLLEKKSSLENRLRTLQNNYDHNVESSKLLAAKLESAENKIAEQSKKLKAATEKADAPEEEAEQKGFSIWIVIVALGGGLALGGVSTATLLGLKSRDEFVPNVDENDEPEEAEFADGSDTED